MIRKIVSMAAMLLALAGLSAAETTPIKTQTLSKIVQLNEDGFGSKANKYAFSMAVFKDALYVGTLNIKGMPGMWRFFSGTTAKRATEGAEIWRYQDGTWTRVVERGLDSRLNLGVRKMAVCGDCLYAVTANHDQGMEVWRTCDGVNFQVVADKGFGNPLNTSGRGLGWFKGFIYVGTENRRKGAELYRSRDGETWEKVASKGLGDRGNWWFSDFAEFKGHLYLGTLNIKGFQLFRTPDGERFERLLEKGADKKTNFAGMKLIVFNDRLLVSTMDFFRGFDLYLSEDGVNFRRVLEKGYADRHNAYLWQMEPYHGRLYAGTYNHRLPLPKGAFHLYSTEDGENWLVENTDGFGNPWFYGVRSMAVFQDKLIIGTASARYGCKVFAAGGD